ncbi:aldolase [Cohnella sp. AR92]|uniref:aldolase n=1 Tax=Cohnella sp. AR92 TaxID=648716 RepID=UPI000F8E103E|nr:aldolase [Cohnella sp. AR92]RUS45709.1 aldolase [Cohnella sp. AR92]
MTAAAAPVRYTAFGLRIRSEYPLPELLRTTEQEGEPDVEIAIGDLSGAWNRYGGPDDYYAYPDDEFLFRVPEVAIFGVRGGKHITVSPFAEAEEKSIRLYLLGTCMGSILMQRGTLPLHGSAVEINGRAYAFVGESGAGKSTLARAFLSRGYRLLSDDVIAVSQSANGGFPIVMPAYPQQKLWRESMDRLGVEPRGSRHLYESKYAVPVASGFAAEALPLDGIFELGKTEGREAELSPYRGLERLAILRLHTYRPFLIPRLTGEQWHLSAIAGLSSQVDLYRMRRPSAGFSAYELAERVLETVLEGEKVMRG